MITKSALIIIDQQKGIDHPKLGQRNNPDAELVMLKLLEHWRNQKWPIVHVMHCSVNPDSVFWPRQEGYECKPEFLPLDGEQTIEKSIPCAFTKSVLEKTLQQKNITSLVIVGVATSNSVEATARTGGNLGFKVMVIEDACFTFEKADYFGQHRSAQDVHAMSLANLNGEYATVVHSSAVFNDLQKLLLDD